MPKICYIPRAFSTTKLALIAKANEIAESYARQGFDLTLRQLYYQFVARAILPNRQEEYKRLGDLINDARLAGLMDWDHIVDRTRNLQRNSHWAGAADIVSGAAATFRLDRWAAQANYVEVWVEKDALLGIVGQAASKLDCPWFSCRGYTSQSEMWGAATRLSCVIEGGRTPHIVHLGDHDPSGMDMSRDIFERLKLFVGDRVHVLRAALNMAQITKWNPPPNPAKVTDSRFTEYQAKYGDESWELDALDPGTLTDVIQRAVFSFMDQDAMHQAIAQEKLHKAALRQVAGSWEKVLGFLDGR